MVKKNIGLDVKVPEGKCEDKNCVFHGNLSIRGRQFIGEVKKVGSPKSVTVEWQRLFFIPKYQRYEKRKTKLNVHNPQCINAKEGDKVLIAECRKISKTKGFIIVGRIES
ncbi:unnamed protein product [marine sediment metagenome]|uniref:30S ribosomal protein S17 n=1 Tax=marine sediment metagenome TaxID=412755 RepID=X0YN15_9ZZZZ